LVLFPHNQRLMAALLLCQGLREHPGDAKGLFRLACVLERTCAAAFEAHTLRREYWDPERVLADIDRALAALVRAGEAAPGDDAIPRAAARLQRLKVCCAQEWASYAARGGVCECECVCACACACACVSVPLCVRVIRCARACMGVEAWRRGGGGWGVGAGCARKVRSAQERKGPHASMFAALGRCGALQTPRSRTPHTLCRWPKACGRHLARAAAASAAEVAEAVPAPTPSLTTCRACLMGEERGWG
jgi:hypothetical protein